MIIARWCVYRFSKHRSCLNHLRWSMCSEGRWGDRRNGKESLVGGRDRTMEATDAATRVPACRDRQGTNRGKHKMFEAGARLRLNQEQSSEHLMSVVMCRCLLPRRVARIQRIAKGRTTSHHSSGRFYGRAGQLYWKHFADFLCNKIKENMRFFTRVIVT